MGRSDRNSSRSYRTPLDEIKNVLSALTIGYEVIEVGENHCTIGSFSQEEQDKIAVTIRKCFFMIKDIQTILLNDLNSKKFSNLNDITSMNENIRRLTNYSIRTTIKTTKDPNEIQYNSMIFSNIYLYSTKLAYIYLFLKKEKEVTDKTEKILNDLFMMFIRFYDAYYKKDLKIVHEVLQLKKRLSDELNNSIEKKTIKFL